MKEWTKRELEAAGYTIDNMYIDKPDLSMQDHGCLILSLPMSGGAICVVYGGYCLGNGYLGADEFRGSAKGMEYIMRIMDTIGVEKFNDLNGKYCRIATKGWGDTVKIIGHITDDKWFDPEEFFKDE